MPNPSPATRLRLRLADARLQQPDGKLSPEVWDRVANAWLNEFYPIRKPPKPKSTAELSDEEWMADLEQRMCYAGIDLRRELGKMQIWSEINHKKPTRRRFVAWLNRAEKTISVNGIGQSSQRPKDPMTTTPPFDWLKTAHALWDNWDNSVNAGRAWTALDAFYRTEILKKGAV